VTEGKKQLDAVRETLHYPCEPVPLPREVEQFLYFFCGDAANPQALSDTEPQRITFYKAVATFVRDYADIAQSVAEAGYSDAEASTLKKEVVFCGDTRNAIKKHSGEERCTSSPTRPTCGTCPIPMCRPIQRVTWAT
jgi:type I restriction enzyme R subunit